MTKQLNILLADDDKDDRFFFEKALKEVSFPTRLTTVEDGQRLMDFLTENSEQLPDVIFLDLNMPKKNGNECLSEIKHNAKLKAIPVVVYSTSLYEEAANELYREGAHYYLQKPDFLELTGAIEKTLTMLVENPQRPDRNKFVVKPGEIINSNFTKENSIRENRSK